LSSFPAFSAIAAAYSEIFEDGPLSFNALTSSTLIAPKRAARIMVFIGLIIINNLL